MHSTRCFAMLALLALGACQDVTAPAGPRAPLPAELLIAVDDADVRLVPALDADARAPMHAALMELRAALDARDVTAARRANAIVSALVAGHQSEHASQNAVGIGSGDTPLLVGPDGPDLAALGLLVAATEAALESIQ